jgi:hypothetical protein
MKIILFLVVFVVNVRLTFAQNLVLNYNFEDTLPCSNYPGPPNLPCIPWYQSFASPDYFSSSYTTWCGSAPLSFNFGYQLPYSGTAYCGFATYLEKPFEEYREFLGGKLTDTLKAGHKYCVSYYASAANDVKYFTDKIGVYFSKDSVFIDTAYYFNITPQVETTSGIILKDTLNWVLITGDFVAQGGERFFSMGNFANKANTQVDSTYNPLGYHPAAYYYIEDVSVMDCTVGIVDLFAIYFQLQNNPAKDILHFTSQEKINACAVFDMLGSKVMSKYFETTISNYELDVSKLKQGMYLLMVEDKNRRTGYGKFLKM